MMNGITMDPKALFRFAVRHVVPWLAIAVVPVAVNLLIWKIAVIPARAKLAAVQELATLVRKKPQLEALIAQSDRLLLDREQAAAITEDSASAEKWIQILARTQGVKIEEINKKEPEGSAADSIPVDLKVTGGYFRLTRWLNVMEANPNIQTDRFLLRPPSAPGADNQLDVTVRVFSKNS